MLKIIVALVISALSVGCATEARIDEYQACRVQGMQKYPVKSVPQNYMETEYFQRQEGMTCTRIPSGFYNAGGMECEPNMRTYQRQVQKTRYIDENTNSRNIWIEQCTNRQCISKFGNSDCEVKNQSIAKPAIVSDLNFVADIASACRSMNKINEIKKNYECIDANRKIFNQGSSAIDDRFSYLISKNRCEEAAVFFKYMIEENKFKIFQAKSQLDNCKKI